MIKYFNIEYTTDGTYHLFINGVSSKSMSSDTVDDELKTWIDDINRS